MKYTISVLLQNTTVLLLSLFCFYLFFLFQFPVATESFRSYRRRRSPTIIVTNSQPTVPIIFTSTNTSAIQPYGNTGTVYMQPANTTVSIVFLIVFTILFCSIMYASFY